MSDILAFYRRQVASKTTRKLDTTQQKAVMPRRVYLHGPYDG